MKVFIWTIVVLYGLVMVGHLEDLACGKWKAPSAAEKAIAVFLEVALVTWGLVLLL